jgi:hypothetical protein
VKAYGTGSIVAPFTLASGQFQAPIAFPSVKELLDRWLGGLQGRSGRQESNPGRPAHLHTDRATSALIWRLFLNVCVWLSVVWAGTAAVLAQYFWIEFVSESDQQNSSECSSQDSDDINIWHDMKMILNRSWWGTMLQAERWRVPFPMRWILFSIYLISPAAVLSWGRLDL